MAHAEAGAVDLLKVAAWAEFLSAAFAAGTSRRKIRAAIETPLKAYAAALRSMATKPAGGSQTRHRAGPRALSAFFVKAVPLA